MDNAKNFSPGDCRGFYFIPESQKNVSAHSMPVLVRVSIPASIRTKKQVGEERVYSAYTSTLLFITEGRTGTEAGQEAGADAQAMERCFLLACFPWLAQLAFL